MLGLNTEIPFLVPSVASITYIQDCLAREHGICAGFRFFSSVAALMEYLYLQHHSTEFVCNKTQVAYLIYHELCSHNTKLTQLAATLNTDDLYTKFTASINITDVLYEKQSKSLHIQQQYHLPLHQQTLEYLYNNPAVTFFDICYYFNARINDSTNTSWMPKQLFVYDIWQFTTVEQNFLLSFAYITTHYHQYSTEYIHNKDIADLEIQLHKCQTKLQEVQNMIVQLATISQRYNLTAADILVTAFDIQDYATVLDAVLANHKAHIAYSPITLPISYQLCTDITYILIAIKTITANSILTFIMHFQQQLCLKLEDISIIRIWLQHHAIQTCSNVDMSIAFCHKLVHSLSIGCCLTEAICCQHYGTPIYPISTEIVIPIDIDTADMLLCDRFIAILHFLETIHAIFYTNNRENTVYLSDLREVFSLIAAHNLLSKANIGELLQDLAVLDDLTPLTYTICCTFIKPKRYFIPRLQGGITIGSLDMIRGIPFKCIYVLGLSNLSHYSSMQFQAFNSAVQYSKHCVIISCREFDSAAVAVSPHQLVNALLGKLSSVQHIFQHDTTIDSLQYIIYDQQLKYRIAPNKLNSLWFNQLIECKFKINPVKNIQLTHIMSTFLYTNSNLYRTLNLVTYNLPSISSENLGCYNKQQATLLAKQFLCYHDTDSLAIYLANIGVIARGAAGTSQLEYYLSFYKRYHAVSPIINKVEFIYTNEFGEQFKISATIGVLVDKIITMVSFQGFIEQDTICPYQQHIELVLLATLCKYADSEYTGFKVYWRYCNDKGQICDSLVLPLSKLQLDTILVYYIYSTTAPVFASVSIMNKLQKTAKRSPIESEQIIPMLKNSYDAIFGNTVFMLHDHSLVELATSHIRYACELLYNYPNQQLAFVEKIYHKYHGS